MWSDDAEVQAQADLCVSWLCIGEELMCRFDMDFATTCAIKSAARGEVMSVVDNVARCLKPGWQK